MLSHREGRSARVDFGDTVPHALTAVTIKHPSRVHVVEPQSVPNPSWLRPGLPSAGQQVFGDALLAPHSFIAISSLVSIHIRNVIFDRAIADDAHVRRSQERFALDTRLDPPATT